MQNVPFFGMNSGYWNYAKKPDNLRDDRQTGQQEPDGADWQSVKTGNLTIAVSNLDSGIESMLHMSYNANGRMDHAAGSNHGFLGGDCTNATLSHLRRALDSKMR